MKHYKLVTIGTGGEFAMGVVTDTIEKELLLALAESGELSPFNASDDGQVSAEFYNYGQILQTYGSDVNSVSVTVVEIDDDNEEVDDEIEVSDIHSFTHSNPWIGSNLAEKYDESDLIFGAFTIEKNIYNEYFFEAEEFDEKNLFISVVNMDETFGDFEIVHEIYYIPDDKLLELWELYDSEIPNTDVEEIADCLGDIYDTDNKEIMDIFNSCLLESMGADSGETKSSEATLLTITGEEIFATWN